MVTAATATATSAAAATAARAATATCPSAVLERPALQQHLACNVCVWGGGHSSRGLMRIWAWGGFRLRRA